MLNLKKVIALVCVLALTLTTVAFGATYTDVTEDSAYYEAVETLNKLGIVTGYEDGTFKPEDGVTRAEMAALIARIQGYGETAKASANTDFADVPASHWASGYIANAAGMGIINGYGDGNFGPEDPVLYEQAVKMVMATLGYTPFAEKNGGYPTGYLAAAQRYNVSLAVANAAVGQEANRGTVAQLLENALDTPLMIQAGWNTNGEVEYKIAEGELVTEYVYDSSIPGYVPVTATKGYKTLMSENLGYVKIRGILYQNDVTYMNNNKDIDTTEESKVWISVLDDYGTENKKFAQKANNEYLVGDLDVDGLIGRSVIAYTKANAKDEFELLSIAVDTNRNHTLKINVDQFAALNDDTAGDYSIEYYKEGANDTTKVKIEDSLVAIVNGDGNVTEATVFDTWIGSACKFGGEIELIDNDDINGYDVAIVTIASTAVVKKVTEDGIYFYNNVTFADGNTVKELEIDPEDETKIVKIMKDGEEISAADLVEWDVLSAYVSPTDADYIVAEVVANEVVGTITSTKKSTTSADGYAYKVADAWYDVARGVYDEGLAINEGGKFYIDAFGKIGAFVEDSALAGGVAANYAYVLGIDAEPASFGATGIEAKMQVVTADGVEVLNVKNNAKVKGSSNFDLANWADDNDEDGSTPGVQTDDKFFTGDTGYSTYSAIVAAITAEPVIKYTKNSAGYITEITLADYDTPKFASTSAWLGNGKYDVENSKFVISSSNKYVDEDALVFIIDSTDKANCKLGSLADLEDQNNYNIDKAYADNKADSVNIIVTRYADIAAAGNTANLAVVTGIGSGYDEETGEAVYEISYRVNGEEKTATTTGDAKKAIDAQYTVAGGHPDADDQIDGGSLAAALTIGDIVKVKVGSAGLITSLTVVWDFAEDIRTIGAESAHLLASPGTDEDFFGGVVKAYDEKSTEVTIGTKTARLSKAANVYVVDNNGKNLVIKNGSDGNFKYFEKLYATTGTVKVGTAADDDAYATADMTNAGQKLAAQAYADHVYVRTYEDKPTDIIIVKGNPDVKVK